MDPLSRILRSVRLEGSVISIAELSAPFGVETRGASRAAVFHAIVEGEAHLRANGEVLPLTVGDVVMLSHGQPHALADTPTRAAAPLSSLPRAIGPVPIVRNAGPDRLATTRIVCGAFKLDHASSDSLLSLMPPLLHHRAGAPGEASEWVRSTVRLLDAELRRGGEGCMAVASRLCDVLFVQLLRAAPRARRGWLAALDDPQIGRALAMIHEDGATKWDASVLAERVGLSRTRFFARFSELVGEPPAQYISKWRMSAAADALLRADVTVSELAERTGYGSEDAFVRVFKRTFGKTPSAYRRSFRDSA
ncbi:MAG: AraC family transcriptional regulator [Polyangiaceae bacterium]|nr:AraC family transcriptional regulator [Polyangiaceae bacterium]